MRGGAAFRRAVAASVGVHALLAVGLVLLVRWQADRPQAAPQPPAIDTRVDVRIGFLADGPSAAVETPGVTPPATSQEPPEPPRLEEAGGSRPPLAKSNPIPRTLPPELLSLLRKTAAASDVVEVPVTPAEVRPAGGAGASQIPGGPMWAVGGSPVHGPLAPGQTIVYVLDASGSMGAHGKFDTARRVLIATLRSQPETVRFQVVVYAGAASIPFPASAGGCIPATAENITRMIDALQAVAAPAGRSHHIQGVQKALSLRPDLVLIFTDADDLPAPVLRGVLKQAAKPAVVCVAKVAAGRVGPPAEMK